MPLACPTCIAEAPVEVAWSLFDPARLDEWWGARLRRVVPAGPIVPGQRIEGRAGPLGMFKFSWEVLEVGPSAYRLHLLIRVPFGIINDEMVTMASLGPDLCRISFG